ncbi:MAG: YfhO family protein, partial [Lachnospiraceae bacterium]|nr:YfhO family protein [Lachnospiraceae bacterium]
HKIYISNSIRAVEKIPEDDFYRIDTVDYPSNTGDNVPYSHTPANMALYWDAPAISEYLSTVDSGWLEFNHLLGNNSGYFRRMCTYSNDNRARMDFLLGVKYFLGSDSKKEIASDYSKYAGYGFRKNSKSKGVAILKSAYNAGLGYVYDSVIADTDLLNYSQLEREQILMQSAEVKEEDLDTLQRTPKQSLSEISLENTKQIPYQLSAGDGMKLSGNGFSLEKPSTLTIQLNQTVTNSEIYVVFKNLKKQNFNKEKLWKMSLQEQAGDKLQRNQFNLSRMSRVDYGNFSITITRGGITKRVLNAEGEPQGIRDVEDYIVNTGYVDQYTGKIKCNFETIGKYSYDDIQILAVPMENFAEQASALEQHRLQVTRYGNDRIEGNIDTEQGGLLYLSIFYDSGWDIYIDGKKADKTYRVNTAFMGVEVSEGYHDIVMKFQPLGAPYTYLVFGVGVISAGLLYYLSRRKRTHQKEKTKA